MLLDHSKAHQYEDPHLITLKGKILQGDAKKVVIEDDGVMRLCRRLCMPNVGDL